MTLLIAIASFIHVVDESITLKLGQIHSPAFVNFFSRTLFEGDQIGSDDIIIFGMLGILAAYVYSCRNPTSSFSVKWRPSLGFAVIGALVSAVYFVHGTKWVMGRARPSEVVSKNLDYSNWFEFGSHFISEGIYRGSFPSGHTVAAFLPILLAYILAGNRDHSFRTRLLGYVIGALAFIHAGMMAIARTIALSHWISDGVLGIIIAWGLIHLIYFKILRIPDQNSCQSNHEKHSKLPPFWEIRIGLWTLGCAAGIMFLMLGIRAAFRPEDAWFTLLMPSGFCLAFYCTIRVLATYRKFNQHLCRLNIQ